MTSPPPGKRTYRALLRLLPKGFRDRYAVDLSQIFEQQIREAREAGRGTGRVWLKAVADVGSAAVIERVGIIRGGIGEALREGAGMDGWVQDLRFGGRTLLRRPGFTLAAVATLALGIGATVSIFSVVHRVLLTPLPYPEPDRIMAVWSVDAVSGERGRSIDHPDVREWQDQVQGLRVAGYSGSRPTLTGMGTPEVISGAVVTDGLITLFGLQLEVGRDVRASDDVPDGPGVVVVSHAFWTDRLGGTADALGTTLRFSGEPFEVIGVAPVGFDFPRGAQFWAPRRHQAEGCGHGCRIMAGVARLESGATLDGVQAQLDAVSARQATAYPDSHTDVRTELEPMLDVEVADVREGLWVLFGAVAMVLLIACANVANLLLVRASARVQEIGLRATLGASRGRIVRQLLTESFLLAGLAGALGLGLSSWGTSAMIALAPSTVPRLNEAGLAPAVIVFTLVLVAAVTSLFGVIPAVQLSRGELSERTAQGRRSAGRRGAGLSRSVLVAGEVALSLVLLLGAGLLFRTLVEIQRVDYGFEVADTERFRLSVPSSRYDSLGVVQFLGALEEGLGGLPGIDAVGLGFGVPLAAGSISTSVAFLDRPEVPEFERPEVDIRPASHGFLAATGTPLRSGRWISREDLYGSEPVAVINEAALRAHFPGVDPIGRQLRADISFGFATPEAVTIVGVVGDVRTEGATADPAPAVYLPNAQLGMSAVYVWMRLRSGVATAMPETRALLREMDPEIAITSATTMEEVIASDHATPRFYMTLLIVFSTLAVVLASIGLYGVVAYSVSQRTREIGIRVALGAASDQVVRMVVRQGVRPVVGGVILGLALSIAGARVLDRLLYGVRALDPLTLVAVTTVMLLVACAATLLPALRASSIPAAQALRSE